MSQAGKFFISGGGTGFVSTLTGDTGGPATPDGADNINIAGGSNINTSSGAHTVTINLDQTIHWPDTNAAGTTGIIYLNNQLFMHDYGTDNVFLGRGAGNLTLTTGSAIGNTIIGGATAGEDLTTGANNSGVGAFVFNSLTTGSNNCAMGSGALGELLTGNSNIAIGYSGLETALGNLQNGSSNIAIGPTAGSSYITSESSNIVIGNTGMTSESNAIHIGTQGSGGGEQNVCYIAGIEGVNIGSVATVVSISSFTGQLGSTTITAGTGITVTPGANTITVSASGTSNFDYTGVNVGRSPYVVISTDEYLAVDSSGGAVTIELPNAPAVGRSYIIKDSTGSAAVHNITIISVSGAVTIDGSTTFVMNTNYEAIQVLFNGSTYEVF